MLDPHCTTLSQSALKSQRALSTYSVRTLTLHGVYGGTRARLRTTSRFSTAVFDICLVMVVFHVSSNPLILARFFGV